MQGRKKLETYITSLIPMQAERVAFFAEQFKLTEFKKNEIIIKEGTTSKEAHFIDHGYIRSFILDKDGEEVTTNIFSAPCFANDFLSFFKQQPTSETFQAITDCIIWSLPYEKVQNNFHNHPEFREFGRMMLVTNYSKLHERMLGMIKDTAEIRYLNLIENHPHIFQNVPLKIIASYLGITDSSLSRIRKEITKNDFLPNGKLK